jgi:cytochrome c peroxidase
MKWTYCFLGLLILGIGMLLSFNDSSEATLQKYNSPERYVDTELNSLINELKDFRTDLSDSIARTTHYFQARKYYKHIEFFVEHISPIQAKNKINGALVPKFSEYQEGFVVNPCGFQRVEEMLFSGEAIDQKELDKELLNLIEVFYELKNGYGTFTPDQGLYLEMFQLQLMRIAALNLNGYDATFVKTNIQEAVWNLEGMREVLSILESERKGDKRRKSAYKQLLLEIQSAQKVLLQHPDFNSFNRLDFIVLHLEAINGCLVEYHRALNLPWNTRRQGISLESERLFTKNALNPQFFSIYYSDHSDLEKQASLGKLLFYDPILSGNNERACSSCHQPGQAFSDGLKTSLAFNSEGSIHRNAPTLIDVIFQKAFFYDGKAYQLEQQIRDVVHNESEMGAKLADVVLKLRKSEEYKRLFREAFETKKEAEISEYAIQKAIAEYEKKLVSMNSRFDQYLNGNRKTLNEREIRGYNLFGGKALCGSCHFFPLFNGTVPPYFMDSEYEIIGVPETKENKSLDPDKGRFLVTRIEKQKYAFKTPSVRNCELTAPYMHNGVYTDLKQVLDFYKKGGGEGLKYAVPNQTLPFDSLQLSDYEQEDIILFLKTLTDTSGLVQRPFKLPAFESQPGWNNRIWGGKY